MLFRNLFYTFALTIIASFFLAADTQAQFGTTNTCRGTCVSTRDNCPNGMTVDSLTHCDFEGEQKCCVTSGNQFPISGQSGTTGGNKGTGNNANNNLYNNNNTPSGYPSSATNDSYNDPYNANGDSSNNPSYAANGSANGNNGWQQGIQTAGQASGLPQNEARSLLLTFMKWLLGVFIILAFLSFVITGIMFLLAGSNKNLAENAKTGFTYSIIALIVTLSAYIIIVLIFELLQGGFMF